MVWAWRESLPLIHFGLKMAAAKFAIYLQRNIDSLLIGKLLSATALGFYALAYRIMYSPVRQVSDVFVEVLFPVLSSTQGSLPTVRKAYSRTVKFIAMITFPCMTLVVLFSGQIVVWLFGAEWAPAGKVIAVLAPTGALQSTSQIALVVFQVVNRPGLSVIQSLLTACGLAAGVTFGSRWGVVGAAYGILATSVLSWLAVQWMVNGILRLGNGATVKLYRSSCICCALILLVFHALKRALGQSFADPGVTILSALCCCAAYFVILALTEKEELIYLKGVFLQAVGVRAA
jgi:PST family polysaccharide transporter